LKNGKEDLYRDLKRRVITLELEPGANLDEMQLSREYGISRTPLRDVFRHLAGEGYLVIESNRGACVSPMSHKTLRDFFLAAPMMYAAIGRLAARNAKPHQIGELGIFQKEFAAAVRAGSTIDLAIYNNQFHHLIGEMADNEFLKPSYERLLIDHARIANTYYQAKNPALQRNLIIAGEQHLQMIEAFRQHDEQRSEELAYEHWILSRKLIMPSIAPQGLSIGLEIPQQTGGQVPMRLY
tara:strand:+ start:125319 stop:126035 length:717 start_codon:yes stop_codon:yes gene_type:complete